MHLWFIPCSAIVAINYELNKSASSNMDLDGGTSYIINTFHENSQMLKGAFQVNNVRSGIQSSKMLLQSVNNIFLYWTVDIDQAAAIQNSLQTKQPISMKFVVSMVTGGVATVGVIGFVAGLFVYARRRRRQYEKIPLLSVEWAIILRKVNYIVWLCFSFCRSQQGKWFKTPDSKSNDPTAAAKF